MMENAPERVMMTGCPKQRKVGFIYILESRYRKVVSIKVSWLEAGFRFYQLFMKGKFDVYLLWPFKKKLVF